MGSGLEKLATLVVLLAALFVFILYIYACGLACLAALLDALPWCRAKKKAPPKRGSLGVNYLSDGRYRVNP